MNRDIFGLPYFWVSYSKKLAHRIEHPQFVGTFSSDIGRGLRLVMGREGSISEGNAVIFYWLVDEVDGVIADIKYQAFGASALMGALEAASQLLLRKNYDQARRLTADLIDREFRDKPEIEAFPREVYSHLNLVLAAIENASEQCTDIPFDYTDSPLHPELLSSETYPGWDILNKNEKLAVIENVIQKEIRPYIELDAGGVQILDLSDSQELTIAFQGSCTSCHAATGSTLTAIQQILQTRIHPALRVIPDLSFLK